MHRYACLPCAILLGLAALVVWTAFLTTCSAVLRHYGG